MFFLIEEMTMDMKTVYSSPAILLLLASLGLFIGCPSKPAHRTYDQYVYEDGIYRGGFFDLGYIQVNVEFTLKGGVVTAAEFRHLWRDEDYHLETDREPYKSVIAQYQEALDYLVGKDLRTHLDDLYRPENIVVTEVHGYTAATIRSNKIISSIRDALNRGVYRY